MAGFDNEVLYCIGERLQASSAQAIFLMQKVASDVSRINNVGDPEGSVSANPSSLCHDPVSGFFYLKVSGTGNTGWQRIVAGPNSVTLTADDTNSLTDNSFNLFGQKAGTVPVMDTLVAAGNFYFENNAWETQYIVDISTTAGLKGTFTTIQAALNQAVIDGMTFNSPRQIYIRPGTYTENLTIPGGAYFTSGGLQTDPTAIPAYTTISGNHTLADICLFGSNGVQWQSAAGDMFTAGATFTSMIASNSEFYNAGTGQILNAPSGNTSLFLNDCNFATGRADFGTVFTINSFFLCQMTDCYFAGCGFQSSGGLIKVNNCHEIGEVNIVAAASPGIIAEDCTFNAGTNSNIYGAGAATLIHCGFANNDSSKFATDLALGAAMIGCYMRPGVLQPGGFLNPATTTVSYSFSQIGNVLGGIRSAVNVASSNQVNYLGITSTAAPRSVVINKGLQDYQIYVVDESGGAGTNNITITDSGGALINGAASYVINRNYGSALFHTDGTNWFVSSSASTNVGQTITGNTGGALSPTAGNWNIVGTGAITTSGSGSTLTISSTGGGISWLDNSGAFAAAADTGYFLTAASTPTLPAAPAQGTVCEFSVVAAATMTITANTGQVIRLDGSASGAGGTAVASTIGNTIKLVYRTVGTTWWATSSVGASWTIT